MKLTNHAARFGWGFSAFFLLICAAFTAILIREGPSGIQIDPPRIPDVYPPWVMPAVLLAFWSVGVGMAKHLAGIPCVDVRIESDRAVRIRWRTPFRSESRTIQPGDLAAVEVVETGGSDGDGYFSLRLTTVGGASVEIAESFDRAVCESVLADIKRCLEEPASE